MNSAEKGIIDETTQLLAELEQILEQSNLVREIVAQTELLHNIERTTGVSMRTRFLRDKIAEMESRLKCLRDEIEPLPAG